MTIGKEKCQVTPDADQFHHFLDEIVCYADKRPWRKLKIFKKYSGVTELKDMHKKWMKILESYPNAYPKLKEGEPFQCKVEKGCKKKAT